MPDVFHNFCVRRIITETTQSIGYLSDLADFSDELRFILIDWIINDQIEIEMILKKVKCSGETETREKEDDEIAPPDFDKDNGFRDEVEEKK